jgi:hypothetical protein
MDNKSEDRRRHVRVNREVCAWLSFHEDCAAYATLTEDLGPLGAQFCASRSVGVSERLLIDFQFPSKNIGCEANVRWVRPAPNGKVNFGVQFVNLSNGEREYLLQFLSKSAVV